MRYKKTLCFLLAICITSVLLAQTTLPNYFSDSMVLQQQTDAAIWGNDKPKTNITVKGSWGSSSKTITDDKGYWHLKIKTPTAGGPFKVEVIGSSKIVYQNVLVGEVWLCSGQSNMEMPIKGYNNQPVEGSNEVILNSYNPFIRVFTSPRQFSPTAINNVNGYWNYACPANTGSFSATAYFFAKKVQSVLKVPVGLIVNAWGGSSVESWMDSSTLASFKKVVIPPTMAYNQIHQIHTILYKSMIHPCKGYTIKGAIWYQGEGNRRNPEEYQALFSLMINSWRQQWQQGNFPFYFVQIAPFGPNNNITGALLREAQFKTMQSVENTGMAVTLDIGEELVIHPAQKELVGNRLAYWALAKDYNIDGIKYSGPVYNKIETIKGDSVTLSFKYAEMGLNTFGKPLSDFEVAGEDKVFYPAKAMLTKDKKDCVTVWCDSVKHPVSVRYGFKNWVKGTLYNTHGLPASSFRTDTW